jgi:protein Tob/BTG
MEFETRLFKLKNAYSFFPKMHTEIQFAAQYLANYVPKHLKQQFIQDLTSILYLKFQDHWYPLDPERGSAFRSIKNHSKLDSTLAMLPFDLSQMPSELVLWIDPGVVSYRMGNQYIVTLYKADQEQIVYSPKVRMSPPTRLSHPPQVTYRVEAMAA